MNSACFRQPFSRGSIPQPSPHGQRFWLSFRRRGRLLSFFVALGWLALAPWLPAATIVVNSLADSGAGSLRDAVASAADGDTIEVTAQGRLRLTSGLLAIARDLTITGPGTNHLSIDGCRDSIFAIASGVTAVISDFTLTNAFNQYLETSVPGGAIRNAGSLTLYRCVVCNSDNREGFGSGIGNTGSLTVDRCVFFGNGSPFTYGGAIASLGGAATLTVRRSAFIRNIASNGAGIYAEGTSAITDCMIAGNISDNGTAGIAVSGASSIVTSCIITNSTLHGMGGGVGAEGSFFLLSNSTVSDNHVGDSSGGGVWSRADLAVIESCTISSNRCAEGRGGGLLVTAGALHLRNTILAGNTAPSDPDCSGPLISDGYNLIGDSAGCTLAGDLNGVILGLDPRLGPLQNHGGPTLTHALLAGSPAVDAGSPVNGLPTDQRGFRRPRDGDDDGVQLPDIGAFESADPCIPTVCCASILPGNRVRVLFSGCAGRTYAIQSTACPPSPCSTVAVAEADSEGFFEFECAIAGPFDTRYFRAQKLPPSR